MPANLAARRGAAHQRRKAVGAQKRKQAAAGSGVAALVRSAQAMPIQHCLLSGDIGEAGMGILLVARGQTPYSLTVGMFLLDLFSLGVKDAFVRSVNDTEFAAYVRNMSASMQMTPTDPADARKLLRDLVAWSRANGMPPHRDYEKIEAIFGSVDAGASDRTYAFAFGGMAATETEREDLFVEG